MENTQDMARSGARRVRRLIGGKTLGDWLADLVIVLILLLIVASILYPIWFIIIASVSDQTLVNTGQVTWIPKGISAYGFQQILGDDRIWNGYRNTLIYTVAGTVLNLVVTMPAAFALSRPEFKWRRLIMLFFTITMFVNGGLIPTYLLYKQLGLLDSWAVFVIPQALNVYNLIIARSFFESSIPEDLHDAAQIDGGGTSATLRGSSSP